MEVTPLKETVKVAATVATVTADQVNICRQLSFISFMGHFILNK